MKREVLGFEIRQQQHGCCQGAWRDATDPFYQPLWRWSQGEQKITFSILFARIRMMLLMALIDLINLIITRLKITDQLWFWATLGFGLLWNLLSTLCWLCEHWLVSVLYSLCSTEAILWEMSVMPIEAHGTVFVWEWLCEIFRSIFPCKFYR